MAGGGFAVGDSRDGHCGRGHCSVGAVEDAATGPRSLTVPDLAAGEYYSRPKRASQYLSRWPEAGFFREYW